MDNLFITDDLESTFFSKNQISLMNNKNLIKKI